MNRETTARTSSTPAARRRPARLILALAFVASTLAIGIAVQNSELLGRTVVGWLAPTTTTGETDATTTALAKLNELRPEVRRWTVQSAVLNTSLTEAEDATGRIRAVFSDMDEQPQGWVLQFSAPGQGGYSMISALVVVDATTGEVISADIARFNDDE